MAKGLTPIIGLAVVVALAMVAVFGAMSLTNPAFAAVGAPVDAELAERTFSPQNLPAPTGLDVEGGPNKITVTWDNYKDLSEDAPMFVDTTDPAMDWEIRFRAEGERYNPDDWYSGTEIGTFDSGDEDVRMEYVDDDGDLGNEKVRAEIRGLTNYTRVYVQVRRARGTSDAPGDPSGDVIVNSATPADRPMAPTAFKAEPGANKVILSWVPAENDPARITNWEYWQGTDNGSGIEGYETANADGYATDGKWNDIPNSAGDEITGHTISFPDSGRKYHFSVRAVSHDSIGAQPSTSMVTAVTDVAGGMGTGETATPYPSAPKVEATEGNGQVVLSWPRTTDDGIYAWETRYKKTSDDEYTNWEIVFEEGNAIPGADVSQRERVAQRATADTREAVITRLENRAKYDFRVRALATSNQEALIVDLGAASVSVNMIPRTNDEVGFVTPGLPGQANATPLPPEAFDADFIHTSYEPGDGSRYDLMVQIAIDQVSMNTLTDEFIIELEDYNVPSQIGVNSIAINVDDASSADEDRTTIPEDVSVSGEKLFLTIGDLNKDRTGVRTGFADSQGEFADFEISVGSIIHVVIRESAGISNPTEAKTNGYGPVVTITKPDGTVLVDENWDDEKAPATANESPSIVVTLPWTIKLDEDDGGLGDVITATGLGFKDKTTLTVFVDRPVDHDNNPKTAMQPDMILDLGEDVLCQETVASNDAGSCEFTVTHPTFQGGVNYISAVDGRNNTAVGHAEFVLKQSIQASPASGSPGEIMLVQVVDFPVSQPVSRIQLGGLEYCGSLANPYRDIITCSVGSTDGSGSANFAVTVPNWARSGTQQLKVFIGGKNASTNVDIGGPQINVTPGSVQANQRISLVGTGFSSNAVIGDDDLVEDRIDSENDISKISIGGKVISRSKINSGDDVEVDSGGNWSASVDLPLSEATTADGDRVIRVTDSGGRTGSVIVNIPSREVTITPDVGRVGTIALVSGTGFPSKNDEGRSFNIEVVYDAGNDKTTTVSSVPDASGRFEVQLRVPTTASIPSTNTVKVTFEDEDGIAVVTTVAHEVPEGLITLSETSGGPGSAVNISGEGFKAFVPVKEVNIGTIEITPAPRPTTDGNGMVSFDVIIPGLDVGIQTIEVEVGQTTASTGFTVTESGLHPGNITNVAPALEDLGDNFVNIWHFNNDTKSWSFYDGEEGSDLTHLITGETYLLQIKADIEVILNRDTRNLTCLGSNCWNQIVW